MVQPGQTLRMERGGAVLGRGPARRGQPGRGHRPAGGAPFAVKWFRDRATRDAQVDHRLIQRGRPHPAFVWPIDLVSSDQARVRLRHAAARAALHLAGPAAQPEQPSLRTTIGRKLVDAFAALHSSGLCYRDISFGNLRVDPEARATWPSSTTTTSASTGPTSLVKGTGPFMAPEILRDEALPVDRHRPALPRGAAVLPADARPPAARRARRRRPTPGTAPGTSRRPRSSLHNFGRPAGCSSSTPTTRRTRRCPATGRPVVGPSTRENAAGSSPRRSPGACMTPR